MPNEIENQNAPEAPNDAELLAAAKQVMKAQVEMIRFWHGQACAHRFYINAKEPDTLNQDGIALFPTVDPKDPRAMALYKLCAKELDSIYLDSEAAKTGINSPVAVNKTNLILPKK